MKKVAQDVDVVIVEIGGTVGDIESLLFMEVIRQMRQEVGKCEKQPSSVHVTLAPVIVVAQELKSELMQHSVKKLLSIGISWIFCCAGLTVLAKDIKSKIPLFSNVPDEAVITAKDVASIYGAAIGICQ